MKRLAMVLIAGVLAAHSVAFAEDKPPVPAPSPALSSAELSAFAALAQEQRVNAAELRAANAEVKAAETQRARLSEIGVQMYTNVCAARGMTAADFKALTEICTVDPEKGKVVRVEKPPMPAPAKPEAKPEAKTKE